MPSFQNKAVASEDKVKSLDSHVPVGKDRRREGERPKPTPHLDCIHDAVGQDGHLARHGLHPLFELCDVRAGGEHAVEAGRPPWEEGEELLQKSYSHVS